MPKEPGRHGEKAEKRPRKFCDGAGERGWKSSVQAGPCLPWASSRGWGPLASWEKQGPGSGAAKRARSPESQHRNGAREGGRGGERAGAPAWRARERPLSRRGAPLPHDPAQDTHGSVRLRAGATWRRPERTRSPCPSPAAPGPGRGGWPRSRRAAVSGPRLGRGGPASSGWESRERLRLRPRRHVLKSPGAD